jgi:hypothetical protein
MLGEPELDHGELSRVAVTPCPPVPFMAAGQASADDLAEKRPPHRTALAMAVAAIAIVVLGAFLVTGGRGAKAGSPENALPGSAEVARVTFRTLLPTASIRVPQSAAIAHPDTTSTAPRDQATAARIIPPPPIPRPAAAPAAATVVEAAKSPSLSRPRIFRLSER